MAFNADYLSNPQPQPVEDSGFDWSTLLDIISSIAAGAIQKSKSGRISAQGDKGELLAKYLELTTSGAVKPTTKIAISPATPAAPQSEPLTIKDFFSPTMQLTVPKPACAPGRG